MRLLVRQQYQHRGLRCGSSTHWRRRQSTTIPQDLGRRTTAQTHHQVTQVPPPHRNKYDEGVLRQVTSYFQSLQHSNHTQFTSNKRPPIDQENYLNATEHATYRTAMGSFSPHVR
eukprot:313837-Amphidinium_carterae.2